MRFFLTPPRISLPGLVLTAFLVLGGCASPGPGGGPSGPAGAGLREGEEPAAPGADTLGMELPRPDTEVEPTSWADSVLSTLTLREKAGQLIMPWVLADFAPEGSAGHRRIVEMVEDQGVGGIILSVGTPTEAAAKVNELQRRARLPLLVAADLERGAGYRFKGAVFLPGTIALGGATEFPSLMAVGATGDETLALEMGRITGREAKALGIHTPFAPVLDVNNNPENPIINIRSFGEDPAEVSRLGRAFIRGVQEEGLIATGKHFPGHGNTETDSHLDLPVIRMDRAQLEKVELAPFRAAVDEGLGGMMTAHITVPALANGERNPPMPSSATRAGNAKRADVIGFARLKMPMMAISRGNLRSAPIPYHGTEAGPRSFPPRPARAENPVTGTRPGGARHSHPQALGRGLPGR